MIKIVSFNLRVAVAVDGENNFFLRLPLIEERLNREKPDILGFQELKVEDMLPALKKALPDYCFAGVGRGPRLDGECSALAFRKDRFQLWATDTLWLSPTPRLPGSRYEKQSICPRVFTTARLWDNETQKPLIVINTHLDHEFEEARMLGLRQVLAAAREADAEGLPVFILGDFNFAPQDAPYRLIEESGFADLTADLGGTFHDYGRCTPVKIDYILSNQPAGRFSAAQWHCEVPGRFLSDHDPVAVCTREI